jgi:nucleotide-binding universal stress UspA family protein
MFKHFLVPLDGSHLAEAALPVSAYMAQILGARVTLIHLIERNPPQEVHGDLHLQNAQEAENYLQKTAERAFGAEIHVECHVHTTEVGNVAASLVAHAQELGADLIVMCTHGRRGPHEWFFGNIAQQVIATGGTAVLIVKPGKNHEGLGFCCRRILAPLDGRQGHEEGQAVAAALARKTEAALHLLMVIPTVGALTGEWAASSTFLPGATQELLDLAEDEARKYLAAQMNKQGTSNITVSGTVSRGQPAEVIVTTAKNEAADLIVLGTHGKKGMKAFWAGSVAPKVSARTDVPLLLMPLRKA